MLLAPTLTGARPSKDTGVPEDGVSTMLVMVIDVEHGSPLVQMIPRW